MHPDPRKSPWYLDLRPDEMEECMRAFPLLLAVAKLARERISSSLLREAFETLEIAHPDWREWGEG
jgi:hypothetical protein